MRHSKHVRDKFYKNLRREFYISGVDFQPTISTCISHRKMEQNLLHYFRFLLKLNTNLLLKKKTFFLNN